MLSTYSSSITTTSLKDLFSSSNEILPIPSFFNEINKSYEAGNPFLGENDGAESSSSKQQNEFKSEFSAKEVYGISASDEINEKFFGNKKRREYVLPDRFRQRNMKHSKNKLVVRPSPPDIMEFKRSDNVHHFKNSRQNWRNEENRPHWDDFGRNNYEHFGMQNVHNRPPRHPRQRNHGPSSKDTDSNENSVPHENPYDSPSPNRNSNHGPPPNRNSNHGPPPNRNSNRGPPPNRNSNRGPPPNRNSNYGPPPNRNSKHGPPPNRNLNDGPPSKQNSNQGPPPNQNSNHGPPPNRNSNYSPPPNRNSNHGPPPNRNSNDGPHPNSNSNRDPPPNYRNRENNNPPKNPRNQIHNINPPLPKHNHINSNFNRHTNNLNNSPRSFPHYCEENHEPNKELINSMFPNPIEQNELMPRNHRNSRNMGSFHPDLTPPFGRLKDSPEHTNSHGLPPHINKPNFYDAWNGNNHRSEQNINHNSIDRLYITTENPLQNDNHYSHTVPTPFHTDNFLFSEENFNHPPVFGGFKPSYGPPTKPPDLPVVHHTNTAPIEDNHIESESKVYKHITVHVPPFSDEIQRQPRIIQLTRKPEKHYSIVFIKAPDMHEPPGNVLLPPAPEHKTLIYVLTKHRKNPDPVNIVTPKPTSPSAPEVFFVQYKDKNSPALENQHHHENTYLTSTNSPSEYHGEQNIFPTHSSNSIDNGPSYSHQQQFNDNNYQHQQLGLANDNFNQQLPSHTTFPILDAPPKIHPSIGHSYNYNIPLPATTNIPNSLPPDSTPIFDNWHQQSYINPTQVQPKPIGPLIGAHYSNFQRSPSSDNIQTAHSYWSNLTNIPSYLSTSTQATISDANNNQQLPHPNAILDQTIYDQTNVQNDPRTKKYSKDGAFQEMLKNKVVNYGKNWTSIVKPYNSPQKSSSRDIVYGKSFNYSVVTTPNSIASHLPTISSDQAPNGSKSHYYLTVALPVGEKAENSKFSLIQSSGEEEGNVPLYFESKRVVDLSAPAANLLATNRKEKSKYGSGQLQGAEGRNMRVRVVKRVKSHYNNNSATRQW